MSPGDTGVLFYTTMQAFLFIPDLTGWKEIKMKSRKPVLWCTNKRCKQQTY